MVAFESGEVDWTVAVVEIVAGVTTDQYSGTVARMSVVDFLDALTAWATSTFAVGTFTWTWARESATSGAIITIHADGGTFTLECTNADAQTGLGFPPGAAGPDSDLEADSSAAGTWAPRWAIGVRTDLRVLGRGDACGDGAVRPGVPGLASFRPDVRATGTARDAARLASVLSTASSPRVASIYQTHTDTWLTLAVGNIERDPVDTHNYGFSLDVAGEAL